MEIIEDVSDLFLTEISTEKESSGKKILAERYSPRQIGSIVRHIEPITNIVPLSDAMDIFNEDPELDAIPVEDVNGRIIGLIDRDTVNRATDSTFKRITSKNISSYISISSETIMLDASSFIERDLKKITEINRKYGVAHFPVFDSITYSRSFLGIVSLNDIFERIAEIREQDLQKAAIIQNSLFPDPDYISKLPYKVTGWNRMANSLGGDIYQVLRINDDESFISIFDVSGKNVAASLITTLIASFFKITDKNSFFSNKPSSFVSMLDKYISSIVPEGTFVTGIVCYFNIKQNIIYIYNCGHTIAYLFYSKDGDAVQMSTVYPSLSPFGIGMISETLSKKYEKEDRPFTAIRYKQGMHINLYSDGLTDMHNNFFEMFSEDGVKKFFASLYPVKTEKVEDQIKRAVESFTSETLIPDDITVVDIRL